jgi:hypothetical protein
MNKTATIPYALLLEAYEAATYRAYDDPQTFYTGERPSAEELVLQLEEFLEEEDKYQRD